MESLYMPAVPTIFALRMSLYIQIFAVVVLLVVVALLLWYFVAKYQRRKILLKKINHIRSQSKHLEKEILIKKIKESDGEEMVVYRIEYLERFIVGRRYHSISEILGQSGLDDAQIGKIGDVLYAGARLDADLRSEILNKLK